MSKQEVVRVTPSVSSGELGWGVCWERNVCSLHLPLDLLFDYVTSMSRFAMESSFGVCFLTKGQCSLRGVSGTLFSPPPLGLGSRGFSCPCGEVLLSPLFSLPAPAACRTQRRPCTTWTPASSWAGCASWPRVVSVPLLTCHPRRRAAALVPQDLASQCER